MQEEQSHCVINARVRVINDFMHDMSLLHFFSRRQTSGNQRVRHHTHGGYLRNIR
jgi:hypothetical protein